MSKLGKKRKQFIFFALVVPMLLLIAFVVKKPKIRNLCKKDTMLRNRTILQMQLPLPDFWNVSLHP